MEDQDTAPAALPPLRVLLCRAAPRRARDVNGRP